MQRPLCTLLGLAITAACLADAAPAAAADGGPSFQLRLRHESVDDQGFARRAESTTYRARLGYLFAFSPRWSAFAEAEHTGHLFGERYNSTANGATSFPVVADPDNTELDQAWLRFADGSYQATVGRQRLNLGNQRFIGSVGWRQNEQTFDALDLQFAAEGWQLHYAFLDRVQRIFGAEHPNPLQARWNLDSHVLEAGTTLGPGRLSALGLWYDNQSLPATSHRNLGLRYEGKSALAGGPPLSYALELAQQRPHADGSRSNRAHYAFAQLGVGLAAGEFSLGFERLGGDGTYAFQTPLATLHAFNGWADRFLTTPAAGLRDSFVGWKRGFGNLGAAITLHRFDADAGDARYGDEIDAVLNWKFRAGWNAQFKIARYRADDITQDVDKIWLGLEYAL